MRTGLQATARAAIARHAEWKRALDEALDQTAEVAALPGGPDLVLLFASDAHAADFPALVRRTRDATRPGVLLGCSGQGIIGPARELEGEPAIALLAASLPGATLRAVWITQPMLEDSRQASDWHSATGVPADAANGWLIFADPYRIDAEGLVGGLSASYPATPVVGGLASGDPRAQRTHVFLDDRSYDEGAVAVALGGDYGVRALVSQGAEPIGQPWTITGARAHGVETIANRPALEVLVETLRALPPDLQRRAQRNLLVGLVMDERREQFRRGDFLIRNIVGVEEASGLLAIGAHPQVGQTIQFQIRDARAADEDLRELLGQMKRSLGACQPVAALLCSCNGRGIGLFGEPDHDARAVAEHLDLREIAGFFCNGEIGPVGTRNFLHGYTACVALIVPRGE